MIYLNPKKQQIHANGVKSEKYYLKLSPTTNLEYEKLAQLIAERTTLTEYEVGFVLGELQDVIIENLALGRGVVLDRLGIFRPSLSAKAVDSLDEINLSTVRKVSIIYTPSVRIKKALKNLRMHINKKHIL